MLELEVTVPEMELVLLNEDEVLEAMGEAIRVKLVGRLTIGYGAHSPLPRPKDGGRPMWRSGTLANSIAVAISEKRGRRYAVVRPFGDRPDDENVQGKVSRARAKTKELRAAMSLALAFTRAAGGTHISVGRARGAWAGSGRSGKVAISEFVRAKPTKSGQIFKLGSFKVRAADTNAALAGILSVEPKDLRARNGGRGTYRVFEVTDLYQRVALEAAQRVAKFELREVGKAA